MSSLVEIKFKGGIGFEVQAGRHVLTIDLTKEKGGSDEGMSPPEVFMASLGSCVGVYVVRYCQSAKLDAGGLRIGLDWRFSDDKTRISVIEVNVLLPRARLGRRADALLAVARRCLIHQTIVSHPQINVSIAGEAGEQSENP